MRLHPGVVVRRATLLSALALGAFASSASATSGISTTAVLIANPTAVMVDTPVQLTTTIYNGNTVATAATGTVTLKIAGVNVPGCVALPVVNGAATCSPTFTTTTYTSIQTAYTGDSTYDPAYGSTWLSIYPPAGITASATPSVVQQRAAIVYKAVVTGIQPTGVAGGDVTVATPPMSFGTVAFYVDDQPVSTCTAVPVDITGIVTCSVAAPAVRGAHTLKTSFSGIENAGPASATAPFTVLAPEVSAADTNFGSVTVGETAKRTVTVTNTGDAVLELGTIAVAGPFTYAGGTCSTTLAAGASCTVELTFVPTTAGAQAGSLTVSHNAGNGVTKVALTGTAVTVLAPPPATPQPPAITGGTLSPSAKATLSVLVPSPSKVGASSAPTLALPLRCPAAEECLLDGRLTIATSALVNGARAAATESQTVARFSKVQVRAKGLKTVKLAISPAFIRAAQKKGIRRIKATLTINTQLGSGAKTTTHQVVTIVIPRAAKKASKPAVKQQVTPRFTG